MSKPYKLTCYLCDTTEQFADLSGISESGWGSVSQTGIIKEEYYVHNGYCEGHTLEE